MRCRDCLYCLSEHKPQPPLTSSLFIQSSVYPPSHRDNWPWLRYEGGLVQSVKMDKLEGTTNCLGSKRDFTETQTWDLGPEGCTGGLQVQEGTGCAQRETACANTRWLERSGCCQRKESFGVAVG